MSAARPAQPQIALNLLDLKRLHQEVRAHSDLRADEASDTALRKIEDAATEALQLIIAVHGWPGHSLVGEAGADAAWWIAHHSSDRSFQQLALNLLEEAVAAGEATRRQMAFLTDRCRVMADRPQLYGTQFSYHQTDLQPFEVEDPEHLDARRVEMDLEPFDAFEKLVRCLAPPPVPMEDPTEGSEQ